MNGTSHPLSERSQAVVLGGGMAGLAAARVLADAFPRVVIVERDALPAGAAARDGVPQGRHAHALLARGCDAFEQLFPGITADFVAAGALLCDALADVSWCAGGRRLRSAPSGLRVVSASRPLLESVVRRRVAALANVVTIAETDAVDLVVEHGRVRGIGVRGRGTEPAVLEADLVVDATGRASRTPQWLEALGYARPPEERLKVDIRYATCTYDVPPEVMRGRIATVLLRTAQLPRGAVAHRIEGDRVMISLSGVRGERPEATPDGLLAYARSLAQRDVEEMIRRGRPRGSIDRFHVPATVRRRYEDLGRIPEGLIVLGDALCAFNPMFAQGMSVAAVEALLLRECLAERAGLAARFFRKAAGLVDRAWNIASANDREVPGRRSRPSWAARAGAWWMRRFFAAAEHDEALSLAFVRVANLVDPPGHLRSWRLARRVLGTRAAARGFEALGVARLAR